MIVPRDADPGLRVCSDAWAECLRERGFAVSSADVMDVSRAATHGDRRAARGASADGR